MRWRRTGFLSKGTMYQSCRTGVVVGFEVVVVVAVVVMSGWLRLKSGLMMEAFEEPIAASPRVVVMMNKGNCRTGYRA
jgi:hypothetical protein